VDEPLGDTNNTGLGPEPAGSAAEADPMLEAITPPITSADAASDAATRNVLFDAILVLLNPSLS
jgi:hypothetical protein